MCLDEVVVSSCEFIASIQPLKLAFLHDQPIKPSRLLGYFWELDVFDQCQAPWLQRLSQYQLPEVLSWREEPFFELVVPVQILYLLAQC